MRVYKTLVKREKDVSKNNIPQSRWNQENGKDGGESWEAPMTGHSKTATTETSQRSEYMPSASQRDDSFVEPEVKKDSLESVSNKGFAVNEQQGDGVDTVKKLNVWVGQRMKENEK